MEAEIDSWEADFLEQLGEEEQDEQQMDGEGPDEDDVITPKLSNFKEAIQSLDNVQEFLESRGYIEEAFNIGSAVDTLTSLKIKSSQQTSLHDYFTT